MVLLSPHLFDLVGKKYYFFDSTMVGIMRLGCFCVGALNSLDNTRTYLARLLHSLIEIKLSSLKDICFFNLFFYLVVLVVLFVIQNL